MRMEYLKLDYREVYNKLTRKLRSFIRKSGAKKAVIGLSGGLDSSVACAIAARALGNRNVIGLLMPSHITSKNDIEDALAVARQLRIKVYRVELSKPIKYLTTLVTLSGLQKPSVVDIGNISARLRMLTLYSVARRINGIVVGTGDKSESLIGYFTKFGDGGVDVLPLGGLYKTQVRELARELKLPRRVIEKPSSPNLWRNQTAEGELGMMYEEIDGILYYLVDKKYAVRKLAEIGMRKRLVERILKMKERSEHKRRFPPIL